ncbi:sodium-dependent bicarbonate transport family permease [Candidatus Chloroploca sp. M-50]|uniref:Sodium-dependent bicarbonate transport family permease n=1 Tax=Candidatus Chloroploca mongolica TaxID=2528176 RepID=A0ABS4DBW0_9CHLR|nr:sodium-dependent bicarbonate transport family permease [Candidatus Chloroploca mongolica]
MIVIWRPPHPVRFCLAIGRIFYHSPPVIAASSSDISGPPTLRGGIQSANPSAYIGASTGIGTPIALALAIPLFLGLAPRPCK